MTDRNGRDTPASDPTSRDRVERADGPVGRPLDPEQAAKVLLAAHAFCTGDVTQEEIAERLGVSQSQVSRLLRQAREERWLVDRPRFNPPEPGSAFYELWRKVESERVVSKVLENKFRRFFGDPLKRVIVIEGQSDTYFSGAARALLPLLEERGPGRIGTLGVTWGRNIRHVILALKPLAAEPLRADDQIKLVPLCGEPFQDRDDPQSFSSSALALELHRILNGPDGTMPLSIAGVHAFIPQSFPPPAAATVRRLYSLGAGYTSIFTGPDPIVKRLDSVLTAVGVPGDPKFNRGIFLAERIHLGDLAEEDLGSLLGDISGILIPRKGIDKSLERRVRELNERWTGVKERDLYECAARCGDGPGVTVVAQAADRAQLIHRCLEKHLINTLLISRTLADALEDIAERGEPAE